MAYPNDFRETLVAAAAEATSILNIPTGMIDAVYTQYSPNYAGAANGETLNITIPTVAVANATNITSSGVTGITPADTTVALAIDKKWSSNRKITTYDEALSANELAQVYIAPVVEELLQRLDIELAGLVNDTNFDVHAAITGGADLIERADVAAAYGVLRTVGVNITPRDCFLALHPIVYANTVASSGYSAEATVGIRAAELAQQNAFAVPSFNFRWVESAGLAAVSGVYPVLAAHRYSIGLRTVSPMLKNGDGVNQTVIFPTPGRNMPVVLETWYEPKDQARYIHAFTICGYKVVRPEMGVLIETS